MKSDFDKKWGEDFIRSVPDLAGVYIFRDAATQPLYVGKAKNLRRRLSQYRLAGLKKNQRKMRQIVREATTLEYQSCASETEALLLENKLIQTYRPPFNVVGAYAFLYPYLGLRLEPAPSKNLSLAYTTRPELLEGLGFQLFGAFRSRDLVGLAYEALIEILPFIGHEDPARRVPYGRLRYTRISCFRQLPPEWLGLLPGFFRGESRAALDSLFACLLEKPGARRQAAVIKEHVKNLQVFYSSEATRLREVLEQHGRSESMIPQEERDSLFLSMPKA